MAIDIILIVLIIVALIVVGLLVYFVIVFNGLVRLKNNIKKSWANIDVLLKQRHDELPKLIASVKGSMKYESGLLTKLTKARTDFLKAKTMPQKAAADNAISGTLKTLFAVAENYPNLKANESVSKLMDRVSGIENELADRREFYNDSVNNYNIRIQSFPDTFVARMLGYKDEEMFKVLEEEKKDVKIDF